MAHSFRFIYWKVCCYFCVRPKKRRKKHKHLATFRSPPSAYPPLPQCASTRPPMGCSAQNPNPASPQNSIDVSSTSTYCTAPATVEEMPTSSATNSPATSPEHSADIPSYEAVVRDGLRNSHHSFYRPAPIVFQDCAADIVLGPVIPNRYVLESGCDVLVDMSIMPKDQSPLQKPVIYSVATDKNNTCYPASLPPANKCPTNSFVWKHEVRRLDIDLTESQDDLDSSDDDSEEEVNVPMWLCLALVVSYICGGAVLFTFWEKWNFLDSSYFCFVTLTTIGFGDLVPGTAVISDDNQMTLGLCSLYLLFGMALLAMSFNLVQEEVTRSVRCIGRRIGIISDDEDA